MAFEIDWARCQEILKKLTEDRFYSSKLKTGGLIMRPLLKADRFSRLLVRFNEAIFHAKARINKIKTQVDFVPLSQMPRLVRIIIVIIFSVIYRIADATGIEIVVMRPIGLSLIVIIGERIISPAPGTRIRRISAYPRLANALFKELFSRSFSWSHLHAILIVHCKGTPHQR